MQDLQRNTLFALHEAMGIGFRGRTELIAPIEALGRAHLRRQVRDPELREQLTPRYRFGCKRPIMSNHWYPAITAGNARVVTEPIASVDEGAVVTADGTRHEADTIISAIGYRYSRSLLVNRISGADGRTLGAFWNRSPRAYLGSTVPGFPNMFILLGPNSVGVNSAIVSIEAQIAYAVSALQTMERDGIRRLEVRRDALDEFVDEMDRGSDGSVWTAGGCKAYYTDDTGRNFALYPGFVSDFRRRTRRFDPAAYELAS
jgi:cation diffusion facilitator CzcD-associated flavoprotein CzcO